MTNTLIIRYTPREDSNTSKLVDTFIEHSGAGVGTATTHLDLAENPPPLLLKDNLNALLKRNYAGMELSEAETQLVSPCDKLTQQLLAADRLVMAFPMYNFSLPATVKAWADAVTQKDRTFQVNEDGSYTGLCQGKRALVLMTTGADYSTAPYKNMNFASPLIESCLGFMGITCQVFAAYGLNQYPDNIEEIMAKTQQDIATFLKTDSTW